MNAILPNDFADPARAARHDGWTPERQRAFLEAIAEGHTVEAAARLVGLSATAAYSFRRRAPGAPFALGWTAANLLARERLAATLFARAIDGQVETRTRPDGSSFTLHRYDNRLAATMLARLDRQAEDPAAGPALAAARLVAQEFDAFLDVIERDEGPARAGLFLGSRAATEADMAPIVGLARADRYCRSGVARADEVAIADLDPAHRASWTAEQWQRAEAAGLVALGPAPADETTGAQGPQLSQLHPGDEPEEPVWWDHDLAEWRTCFPPGDDFVGEEDGDFGDEDYSRTLSADEEAAIETEREAAIAVQRVHDADARDRFFAACATFGSEEEEEGDEADARAEPEAEAPVDPPPAGC